MVVGVIIRTVRLEQETKKVSTINLGVEGNLVNILFLVLSELRNLFDGETVN